MSATTFLERSHALCATGIGFAWRHGTSRASRPIAGLDAGAACHRGGIEGLAAERATGIGPGAAARHVEGRDTGATFKVTFTGVANINIDDASVSLTASGSGLLPRAR